MNSYLKRPLLFGLTLTVLIAAGFAFWIWPTPYRYDRIVWSNGQSFPVRINRFTGTAEWLLLGAGWERMGPTDSPKTEELKSLLPFDLAGIDLSQLRWESTGYIKGPVYNPTNYILKELTLLVEIHNKKDKRKLLEREYRETVFISSRTVGDIIFNSGFKWEPGREWNINLTEARGAQEVEIKTAKDFIEWKLSRILRDPLFLALPLEERKKFSKEFAEGSLLKEFPDFKVLSKAEQSKVIEFLNKQEER